MELSIGQEFNERGLTIKIVKLGIREIEFLVSGEGVQNPERARVLYPGVFVKWIESLRTQVSEPK